MASAEASVSALEARLNAFRSALIQRGLDPNELDPDEDARLQASIAAYSPAVAAEVVRLAANGRSLEEIRPILGYTEHQEREWSGEYVDFAAALARAREWNRSYWERQLRDASNGGDRATMSALLHMIDKRFYSSGASGDAASLVTIRIPDV
jgi:hypothetical protein